MKGLRPWLGGRLAQHFIGIIALFSALLGSAEPSPDPFASCEERFSKDPDGWKNCDCFYGVAIRQARLRETWSSLATKLSEYPGNPCLLRNRGRLGLLLGEIRVASDELHAAAAGYARSGERAGEVYARINLASLLANESQWEAAWSQLERARAAAESAEEPTLLAEVDLQSAQWQLDRGGELDRVERLLRQVEVAAFASGHQSLQSATLAKLGDVLLQLGRHNEAEPVYQRAIDLNRLAGDLGRESAALQNLAIAHLARPPGPGIKAQSIVLLEEALASARRAHNRTVAADASRLLGRILGGQGGRQALEASIRLARELDDQVLLRLGLSALAAEIVRTEPARARALVAQALRVQLNPGLAIYGWFDRLKVSWETLPRSEATAYALAELQAIEKLRELQNNSLTRAEIFSVWADAYSWLAGHLLEEGAANPDDLDLAFELLERRHARVLLEAAGAGQGEDQEFARLEEVRSSLAENEALLFFQQAYERDIFGDFAGGSWLLVITRGGMRVIPTIDPLKVDPILPTFVSLFSRRDGSEAEAAAGLAKGLLGDALAALPAGIDRLVIVPDEDLHLLPFAALRVSASEPTLAERYELEIVPSATLWLRWRRAAIAPARPAVLALADPELADANAVPAAQERGWVLEAGQPLGALPHARREGRRAVRTLGSASELRVGRDASEQTLKNTDLSRFGVLHFAAHAVVDGERSERSAIVLAASGDDDGLLEPAEIRALDLSGKAVVLSACRSAVGDVLAGEGPLSLAHAFFAAGARTVVASLWPLRDDEAARFFDHFYRHLARGESAGSALAASQREMIAAGEPASAWAGVVLLGDADWHIEPVPERGFWGWLACAALAALGLLALRRRSRLTG